MEADELAILGASVVPSSARNVLSHHWLASAAFT
jgi:hypothetical protein